MREHTIAVRVSDNEYKLIASCAEDAKRSVSDWIRLALYSQAHGQVASELFTTPKGTPPPRPRGRGGKRSSRR